MIIYYNKEVFVKHEKAPTAPPIPRGIYYLVYAHVSKNRCFWKFWQISAISSGCQKHLHRPRPFIWAYSQVSTTIRY